MERYEAASKILPRDGVLNEVLEPASCNLLGDYWGVLICVSVCKASSM
jgi:hypothetical protein